jgi:hypothetical protein
VVWIYQASSSPIEASVRMRSWCALALVRTAISPSYKRKPLQRKATVGLELRTRAARSDAVRNGVRSAGRAELVSLVHR